MNHTTDTSGPADAGTQDTKGGAGGGQPSSDGHAPRRTRPRGWRRVAFPLAAIGVGLLPFVLLEGALAVFGWGNPARQADPYVGFSRHYPLFEQPLGELEIRTSRTKLEYFGPQAFAAVKPAKTFRIFCLGGSTVRGRPYETPTALGKWLEIELNARDPSRTYEVVNCGGLSYASYRLTRILEEVTRYEPDLIIVATGHNEFLEDRTYHHIKERDGALARLVERASRLRSVTVARQLLAPPDDPRTKLAGEVNAKLDASTGFASYHRDDAWREQVVDHFGFSIDRMITRCREHQLPLVLVRLGCNLRDSPPFKSDHRPGLSAEALASWRRYFNQASRLEVHQAEQALQLYSKCAAIDDEHALLHWRMARAYDVLGDVSQAGRHYQQARHWDVCPLRAIAPLNQLLTEIAERTNTPWVDGEGLIARQAADQLPGFDWYVDHVHPTIGGHQLIAQGLAATLEEHKLVTLKPWPQAERIRAYRDHFRSLDPRYLADGSRRVKWLENWARRERLLEETLPIDARGLLELGKKRLAFAQYQEAWTEFHQALQWEPERIRELNAHAAQLAREGNLVPAAKLAAWILDRSESAVLAGDAAVGALVLGFLDEDTQRMRAVAQQYQQQLSTHRIPDSPWFTVAPEVRAMLKMQ